MAHIRYEEEALVRQFGAVGVERFLVDGPQLSWVLVVYVFVYEWAEHVFEALESHVLAAVLNSAVGLVADSTRTWWIILKVRIHTIWEYMLEVTDPLPFHDSAPQLEPQGRDLSE